MRDASYTKFGKLLKLINKKILAPHDAMLPDFLFGGITGRNDGQTYDITGEYRGKWCFEILGIQMGRNKLAPGTRSRWETADVIHKLKSDGKNLGALKKTKRALARYGHYLGK